MKAFEGVAGLVNIDSVQKSCFVFGESVLCSSDYSNAVHCRYWAYVYCCYIHSNFFTACYTFCMLFYLCCLYFAKNYTSLTKCVALTGSLCIACMRYLFIEELPGWRELQVIEFKVTVQIGIQMPGKAHMCCPMCCGVPLLRDLPLCSIPLMLWCQQGLLHLCDFQGWAQESAFTLGCPRIGAVQLLSRAQHSSASTAVWSAEL